MVSNKKGTNVFRTVWLALVLTFLYAPILIMIALSFNASVSRSQWTGFTLNWYVQLFHDPNILGALKTTLEVAVIATVVSTVIGTLGAIGMHSMNTGMANALINVSYLPMTTPDIVTGVSLMLMFLFVHIPPPSLSGSTLRKKPMEIRISTSIISENELPMFQRLGFEDWLKM